MEGEGQNKLKIILEYLTLLIQRQEVVDRNQQWLKNKIKYVDRANETNSPLHRQIIA